MTEKNPDFTEHKVASKVVYKGRLLHVVEDEVRMPNGKPARRECIRHPGAVAMIPLLDDETVVLVWQYRYAARSHFYEIPAGKIDPGEDPLHTARRELREECGYEAADWRLLTTLDPCIGYSDERIGLYLATGLTSVPGALDDEEFIELVTLKLPQALEWVRAGRITDPKTIIGLAWAAKRL